MSLKKIAYNCHKATFLIEKKKIGKISVKEQLELKYHLAGCSVCRLFEKQSMLIDLIVKRHFSEDAKTFKLSSTLKKELSKKIEEELKK